MTVTPNDDLFTPSLTDYDLAQDQLREAMIASHQRDLADLKARGIRPPWVERDLILQDDEYRLLSLVDAHVSVCIDDMATDTAIADTGLFADLPAFHSVRAVTRAIGMKADSNSAAVINRCIKNGWLNEVVYDNMRYVELTDDGQDAVWDHEEDLTLS